MSKDPRDTRNTQEKGSNKTQNPSQHQNKGTNQQKPGQPTGKPGEYTSGRHGTTGNTSHPSNPNKGAGQGGISNPNNKR